MADHGVRVDRMGAVAVVVLARAPANLLDAGLEEQLCALLDAVEADAAISAIILRGEGRGFSAGLALEEALDPARLALHARTCARIEACRKPVIAAIHGMALGAGLELALAAHWRIAHEAAMFGCPEASLGLLPGGGGTQRLPRLVGAEAALRLLLTARPIPAAEALALGLIDEVSTGILGQAALALAEKAPALRPTSARVPPDLPRLPGLVAEARARAAGAAVEAPARIVDCVEAAGLLPFEMGANMEAAAYEDLAATEAAAGLVHALQAERLALHPPAVGRQTPEVRSLGLLGASETAAELALQAVRAGLDVVLVDPDRAALTAALASVVGALDADVAAGRMTPEARETAWSRVAAGQGEDLPEGLDLVLVGPEAEGRPGVGVLGAAARGAGITLAEGPGGLAELSQAPGADLALVDRLAALGRVLGWRVVGTGPGGPLELGLRLALEDAVVALSGTEEAGLREELARAGFGGAPALRQGAPGPRVRAVMAALAAEGGRMLADGRARRPAEVDAVAVLSGLVPRWMGGPLHMADRRGPLVLRAELRKLGGAGVFAVPPRVEALVAEGGRFGL